MAARGQRRYMDGSDIGYDPEIMGRPLTKASHEDYEHGPPHSEDFADPQNSPVDESVPQRVAGRNAMRGRMAPSKPSEPSMHPDAPMIVEELGKKAGVDPKTTPLDVFLKAAAQHAATDMELEAIEQVARAYRLPSPFSEAGSGDKPSKLGGPVQPDAVQDGDLQLPNIPGGGSVGDDQYRNKPGRMPYQQRYPTEGDEPYQIPDQTPSRPMATERGPYRRGESSRNALMRHAR